MNIGLQEGHNLNWQNWLKEGDQFLKASKPESRSNRFGTSVVYNLLSMALEKYIMAILDYRNSMPDNHTYTDLFNALDKVISIDAELKVRIMKYENIQSICSIEKYHTRDPSNEEIVDLKEAMLIFQAIAHRSCTDVIN